MSIKKSFIIDLGHVPKKGAKALNGRNEYDIVAPIVKRFAERAREEGYNAIVLDYPERSNNADLAATIARANELASEVDFGISMHADWSSNRSAHGAHVCYLSKAGALLAQCFAAPLCKLMPGRALKLVKRDNLAVLKKTISIWVLVELGFVSHVGDLERLINNIEAIVEVLMIALRSYYAQLEGDASC